MNFDIEKATILLSLHGSRAYGTNTDSSDYDYKGVAIPPKRYFFGSLFRFEQKEELVQNGWPHDKTVYDIRKFVKLASDCNPNIIEILFVPESCYQVLTKHGEMLVENRDLFLSKKARFTFSGYAHSQLKRIRNHRSWLLNPPKVKPERKDFGLPDNDRKVINASTMGAFDELSESGYSFSSVVMETIQKEKQYATALQHWKQYESWKKSRNEDRAALEAKFGYDTKHAMHLMRLMRMCVEILDGKSVLVRRPDAEELLAIRNGAWKYDKLLEEAEKLEKKAEELYVSSSLQKSPDVHAIDQLCVRIVESYLSSSGEK